MQEQYVKECEYCHEELILTSHPYTKYHSQCATKVIAERNRAIYERKQQHAPERFCEHCGKALIKGSNRKSLHAECAMAKQKEHSVSYYNTLPQEVKEKYRATNRLSCHEYYQRNNDRQRKYNRYKSCIRKGFISPSAKFDVNKTYYYSEFTEGEK